MTNNEIIYIHNVSP